MTEEILITGAAGNIGTLLRQRLARSDRRLRLLDVVEQQPLAHGESAELITGSYADLAVAARACDGVTAVIHLGGHSTAGYTWAQYQEVNVDGTRTLLDAARTAGVPRVVVASSHHVVGLLPLPTQGLLADDVPARPDSYYGVSKAAVEALASLYHDRYGIDIVCLRIGSYRPRPDSRRTLWSWLSPGDCVRLFEAALAVASPGYCVVWGMSANRRGVVSLEGGRAIGYAPRDDAERYVHEVLSIDPVGELSPHVGGPYAAGNVDVD